MSWRPSWFGNKKRKSDKELPGEAEEEVGALREELERERAAHGRAVAEAETWKERYNMCRLSLIKERCVL